MNYNMCSILVNRIISNSQIRSCVTVCIDYRHLYLSSVVYMNTYYRNIRLCNRLDASRHYVAKHLQYPNELRYFCTDPNRKDYILSRHKDTVKNEFKNYLEQNKERLRDTEQKLKEKGGIILRDIKETKDKVKEKVEEVIERENIYTIPNFLCVSRILMSPYLGMLIVQGNFNIALVILGVAAFTDLLDGWIARTWESQSSKMGSFLDPMADKVLIGTLFLTLTYADLIPIALTSLIILRDVLLIGAGFVVRYKSLPPPRTLSRYFDVTHVTAQLAPTFISKVNTFVQLILVGTTLAAPVFHFVDHPALQALWYITGATTIAAGVSYVTSKNTYRILNNNGNSNKPN